MANRALLWDLLDSLAARWVHNGDGLIRPAARQTFKYRIGRLSGLPRKGYRLLVGHCVFYSSPRADLSTRYPGITCVMRHPKGCGPFIEIENINSKRGAVRVVHLPRWHRSTPRYC